ncbi:hypothetical protein SPRG_02438 [Saprolegnia parasitica CBS 223.65]|uniref:Endonuclease/exonuclease/phosphatase domain-containing protein n=1 Tax=Saprolegnia parasitica (strain CBS 223.65) TaxID=695850 RepID=A0A067CU24_SAPPC|nr:hypothetical protein SPRG_02438 [Saprolegnia parasitica CBS 223.65]KDO32740.1 hypothetical protein SPRG_02438 [Saprolegnia parasitica CBS 223.65]|eukprot:XP_012196404.1 hypothetical protein SPRG_02438 [Saprolegnia parasitica CBS 223.65]
MANSSFTLCTYNIRFILDRWDERRPFLEDALTRTGADVFALQEVNIGHYWGQHHELRALLSTQDAALSAFPSPGARVYIQAIPLLGYLFRCGNPLAAVFYDGCAWFNKRCLGAILGRFTQAIYHRPILRALTFVGLGSAWVFGTALLAKDELAPAAHDTLILSDWKVAQCVQLTVGGSVVLVANVHLSSGGDEEGLRTDQITKTIEWLLAMQTETIAGIVIVGDFNCVPNGDCYRAIQALGFRSAHQLIHGKEPEKTFHQGLEAPTKDVDDEKTLDYVFVYGQVTPQTINVIGTECCNDDTTLYPSDHFGLVAKLLVSESPRPAEAATADA